MSPARRGEVIAAGVRFGAGSVPVKDCYRHNAGGKRNISWRGAGKKSVASDSALRRIEQSDEILEDLWLLAHGIRTV